MGKRVRQLRTAIVARTRTFAFFSNYIAIVIVCSITLPLRVPGEYILLTLSVVPIVLAFTLQNVVDADKLPVAERRKVAECLQKLLLTLVLGLLFALLGQTSAVQAVVTNPGFYAATIIVVASHVLFVDLVSAIVWGLSDEDPTKST